MYISFLILLNRFITFVCKLFGYEASVFPGSIIYKFDKNILHKLKYPKFVIGVSGSSGKGSTTEVIAHILETSGYNVCWNKSGSNGIFAVMTLLLNNTKLNRDFNHDILLLEMDERHIKLAFPFDIFTHMLITNITRDQPARNIHTNMIYNDIFATITDYTHLIINADDPILNKVKIHHKGKITTYGISKTTHSFKEMKVKSIEGAYCPKCSKKLKYDFYHYGHLGSYECPKCDFGRDLVDYEATDVKLDKKTFKIKGDTIHLNKDIIYAVYYTTAAYTLCREIGISKDKILYALNENSIKAKRGKIYSLDKREINMLESKNENALSYYQSLKYIIDRKGTKTVVLGFDNVSRRYKYNDLSWLWDVEFELLLRDDIDKIICIGRFKYDVATRLTYAGIPSNKLILVDNLNDLVNITKNKSKGNIFTMVCFDMSNIIQGLLKGDMKNENN